MAKPKPLSKNIYEIESTIMRIMDVPRNRSLSSEVLVEALKKFPFTVTISFHKIYGVWICSNWHEDDWPRDVETSHKVSGANFYFSDKTVSLAIARAVHYYFTLRKI